MPVILFCKIKPMKYLIALSIFVVTACGTQSTTHLVDRYAQAPDRSVPDGYSMDGKKYSATINGERHILDIRGNSATLVIISADNSSKIYQGDIKRNGSKVSVRLNKLESEPIAVPLVYNFILQKVEGKICLKDINTNECRYETVVR